MDSFFKKKLTVFILIFAAVMALFISCSQNTPELTTTDYSVIFDYENAETVPEARLSIFAASASDVRRYERIRINSLETGLCWEVDNLTRLENEDLQWAGYTNLVAPENEKLNRHDFGIGELMYFFQHHNLHSHLHLLKSFYCLE